MFGLSTPAVRGRTRLEVPMAMAIAVGVAVFWVLLVVAAALQPGYDAAGDSISSLASRGATDAWVAMSALAIAGAGTMIMGVTLGQLSPPAGLTLGLAGFALMILIVAPLSCVGGAAGCGAQTEPRAWAGLWHFVGVNLYEIAFVAAVASAGVQLFHMGLRGPALVAVVVSMASIVLFAIAPLPMGLRQRLWLALHSAVLVAMPLALSVPQRSTVSHGSAAGTAQAAPSKGGS